MISSFKSDHISDDKKYLLFKLLVLVVLKSKIRKIIIRNDVMPFKKCLKGRKLDLAIWSPIIFSFFVHLKFGMIWYIN